jgi:hypothetical protein
MQILRKEMLDVLRISFTSVFSGEKPILHFVSPIAGCRKVSEASKSTAIIARAVTNPAVGPTFERNFNGESDRSTPRKFTMTSELRSLALVLPGLLFGGVELSSSLLDRQWDPATLISTGTTPF